MDSINHHNSHGEFIEALKLTSLNAESGIFILNINDISEEAAESMAMYRNEFYEINLFKDQHDFKFIIDDKTFHPQGEAYIAFVAPSQLQSYEVLGDDLGSSGYLIYINKDTFRGLNLGGDFPFFQRNNENFFPLTKPQHQELFQIVRKMEDEFSLNTQYSQDVLQSYVRILLLKSLNFFNSKEYQNRHHQQVITQFESLINQQYTRHKSVQYYADELAISVRQLSTITKNTICKSPLQVIHDVILNESKALLTHSKMTMSEIAYTLGFEEVANFSRFFKKYTDLAPSQYKKISEMDKRYS